MSDEMEKDVIAMCREDGVTLTEEEIAEAIRAYAQGGADAQNDHGLQGTVVAANVDRWRRAHR